VTCRGQVRHGPEPALAIPFAQVSAQGGLGCGLGEDGIATCWGKHRNGPDGSPAGIVLQRISVGGWHICGLTTADTLACWGPGVPDPLYSRPGPYPQVASGLWFACAMGADGNVACWGDTSAPKRATAGPTGGVVAAEAWRDDVTPPALR
jgi:hypothetical protein